MLIRRNQQKLNLYEHLFTDNSTLTASRPLQLGTSFYGNSLTFRADARHLIKVLMGAREEQDTELEVLQAIYDQDFRVIESATASTTARFEIDVSDDADAGIKLRLNFTYTPQYPEEPLIVVVHALEGLSTTHRKKLQAYLEEVTRENIHMPCVHTICDQAKEWLVDNVIGKGHIEADEEEERKFETLDTTQTDKVEVISSKAVGTPVTVDSFREWREKFMQETEALKGEEELEKEANKKITGRQLFESKTIVVSAESESFWEAEASQALFHETTT